MTSAHHGFRMLATAVLAPLVVTIAAVLVMVQFAATAPARVATHWDTGNTPNGFGSPYTYPVIDATVSVALIGLLGGTLVLAAHRSATTVMIKVLAVTPVWISILLGVGLGGALLEQPTAASVAHAHNPWLPLLVGAVIASVVAVAGWFVLPKAVKSPADADIVKVAPVALAEGDRASWIRTASASRGILALFIGIIVLVAGCEVLVLVTSGGQVWWFLFVPVVVLLILLSNFAFTVRIDSRGVRIRSVVVLPSITIPLDNITSANVVDVQALAQYGGWGIRWNLGSRLGIILRSGEALEIHRRKGLVVVVTVDDATTAAALINGLVQRQPKTL
jgi:hypothetical protein